MKHLICKVASAALMFGGMLMMASCGEQSKPMTAAPAKADRTYTTALGVAGGVAEDTYTVQTMVRAVDQGARRVTLADADDHLYTFTAGPEVKNLPQLKSGDRVTATFLRRMVVTVRDDSMEPANSRAGALATAAPGEKPGMLVGEQSTKMARVIAMDTANHTADLEFANGVVKRVPVRPDVDMTKYSIGDTVTIRVTTSLTVLVEGAPAQVGQ